MPKIDLTKGDTALLIRAFQREHFTLAQTAYGLATASWETANTMRPVEEAFWLSDAWRKKNLRYYPWHGRGFVQLTWERNYRKMAKRLNRPEIATNPAILLTDAELSARVIAVGMKEGIYTGKRLDAYVSDDHVDYKQARRVINGMNKASDIALLAKHYMNALDAANYNFTYAKAPKRPSGPASATSGFWARLLAFFGFR